MRTLEMAVSGGGLYSGMRCWDTRHLSSLNSVISGAASGLLPVPGLTNTGTLHYATLHYATTTARLAVFAWRIWARNGDF